MRHGDRRTRRLRPDSADLTSKRPSVEVRRADSDLGTWTLTDWRPAPGDALAGLVHRIWSFAGRVALPRERAFPDGTLDLIVHLDDRYRPGVADAAPFPRICVGGLQPVSHVVEAPPGPCRVVGIILLPYRSVAFLGGPLDALTGVTVDYADLAGRAAAELGERCAAARTPRAVVDATVAWVRARLRDVAPDPAVGWALHEIHRHHGNLPIAALHDRLAVAPARFRERFRQLVGVTPKRYARIARFRRALSLLGSGELGLADVAAVAGYYDQPHFNAEFLEHAGMTPGDFLAARRFPGDSIHLAEPAP